MIKFNTSSQRSALKAFFAVFLLSSAILISGFFINTAQAADPSVIINEFMSNPASGKEWVELLNMTASPIDLIGWKLKELTTPNTIPAEVDWATLSGTISANGILVFEVAGTNLNNAGDSIGLYDNTSTLIHRVSYGNVALPYIADLTDPASGKSGAFISGAWQTDQTSTKGWFNDAGQPGKAPLLSTIDSDLNTAGINSNIGELANPSATPTIEPDALYFEKTGKGRIVFEKALNMSDQATVAVLQNLGTAMEMSAGHIKFNSATASAMSATGAKIYMYDLTGFNSMPNLIVKNDSGTVIPPGDAVNYPAIVKSWDNTAKTLSFTASHFTQFDVDNTVYVSPTGNNATGNGSSALPYLTIQKGIDSVPTGGLVNVAAGTYAESVVVSKKVTLQGAGNTTIINPAIDQDGIKITANDVAVKDLKVVTSNSGTNANIAIRIEGANGVEINNNVIETTGNKAMGIWVGGSSNGVAQSTNLKIFKNTITINGVATGIYAAHSNPAHSGWTIGGSVSNANTITMASSNPVELYDVSDSEVSYNTLTITSPVDASNVIWSSELSNIGNLIFKNNTVDGSSGSEAAFLTDFVSSNSGTPILPDDTTVSTVTITGNTFKNWGSRAIRVGTAIGTGAVTGITINSNIFQMTADTTEVIGGTAASGATSNASNTFNVSGTAKIQKAINAAFAGDTINVAAGAYTENINISKTLTLTGAASTTVTVTAANASAHVFNVTANSVEISGFKATGAIGTGSMSFAGINLIPGVANSKIHDNILTGNEYGILLTETDGNTTSGNNTFERNTTSSNSVSGIEMQDTCGNIFTDNIANSNTKYGFKLDSACNNTFTGNAANSNTGPGSTNGKGFYSTKGSGTGSTGNTFTNNTANLNKNHGLHLIGSNINATLTGNIFDGNLVTGIKLQDVVTNLKMDNNSITSNPIGINIDVSVTAGDVTSLTLSKNKITNNTTYGVSNNSTGVLNATQSWWGAVSGPRHLTTNSSATGDVVSDNVTYSKWCTNLACTEFGSNGILASYSIEASPGDSVVLPNSIILTIKAIDAGGIVLVNDSSGKVSLTADRGAAFGSNLLSLSSGVTSTAISNTVIGLVNVLVSQVGGPVTATKQLSFNLNDSAVLAITGTAMEKSFAVADDTFASGWRWKLDVTVPTSEANLKMKFADWLSGSNSIAVAQNVRFYSVQFTNATDTTNAITVAAANSYGSALSLSGDLDISKAGRQIQITVEAKVPIGSAGGSYSTSYGIESN